MAISHISTYGALQNFLQNVSLSQNSLNEDQIAISSGHVSQTFDGLSGNVEQLTSMNAQIALLTNFQQDNTSVISQYQSTSSTLGQIIQIATNIKGLLATQVSNLNGIQSFQQQVRSNLAAIVGELNSTFQGKFIFSGTATSTAPVKSPLPPAVEIGTPDNAYYQGASQDSLTRISDNQLITNSVRADDIAFQKIFAGIAQALQPSIASGDVLNAEDLVDAGIQGIIALQATVNANILNVQQVNAQNQTLQTYFKGLSTSITQSDVVALSTKVVQDQTILQASFSTFARLSSLTLANFLK